MSQIGQPEITQFKFKNNSLDHVLLTQQTRSTSQDQKHH